MECDDVVVISTLCGLRATADLYQDEDGFRVAELFETSDVKCGDTLRLESIHYCTDYQFTVVLFKVLVGASPSVRPHYQWPEITMFEMANKPLAYDWKHISKNVEYSEELELYYYNKRVYDERPARHNGIIGLGHTLRTAIKRYLDEEAQTF